MSGKRLECPELRGRPCTRDDVAQLSVRDRGEAAASSAAPPPVPLGPVLSANQNLNLQHLGPIWVANCYRLRQRRRAWLHVRLGFAAAGAKSDATASGARPSDGGFGKAGTARLIGADVHCVR